MILSVLSLLLFACGADKKAENVPPKEKETTTATTITTYTFNWNAICRCQGTTETPGGKLCSQTGTYTGQYSTEEEAVEKMKEEVHRQLDCVEGPFLAFRYEAP